MSTGCDKNSLACVRHEASAATWPQLGRNPFFALSTRISGCAAVLLQAPSYLSLRLIVLYSDTDWYNYLKEPGSDRKISAAASQNQTRFCSRGYG